MLSKSCEEITCLLYITKTSAFPTICYPDILLPKYLKVCLRVITSSMSLGNDAQSDANTIRSPDIRVLQKMITYGLCQRNIGYNKIQRNELWLLSMFEDRNHERYANVTWVITRWMKRKCKDTQKYSGIICREFVTKLAKKLQLPADDVLEVAASG
nr:hypothetical protein [Tanacetum cinerariifolium]